MDAPDADGSSPMVAAAWTNHKATVEYLLSKGADINSRNHWVSDTLSVVAGRRDNAGAALRRLLFTSLFPCPVSPLSSCSTAGLPFTRLQQRATRKSSSCSLRRARILLSVRASPPSLWAFFFPLFPPRHFFHRFCFTLLSFAADKHGQKPSMYAAFHDHQSIAKILEDKEKELADKSRQEQEAKEAEERAAADAKALQEKAAKNDGRVCADGCVIM